MNGNSRRFLSYQGRNKKINKNKIKDEKKERKNGKIQNHLGRDISPHHEKLR